MGRKLKFKMGSFYRNDDRSGFPQRAEDTKKEWNGLIVDQALWEPRQPQDYVKGVTDDQSVPDARPLPPNAFKGPIYVQLTDTAAIGATVLVVETIKGQSKDDPVGVMLGDGSLFNTTISGDPSGNSIPITDALPLSAPSGNLVVNTAKEPQIFPGGRIPPLTNS